MTPNDLKPFKHGEEETHFACNEQLVKFGWNTPCCECSGHKCKKPKSRARRKRG